MSDIVGTVKRENAIGRLSEKEAAACADYAKDSPHRGPRLP